MMERRFSCTGCPGALAVVVFAILLLNGSSLWAGDGNLPSGTVDYRWISLDHITPEQGREFLTRLTIGTVSTIPTTNRLLVTGRADELHKAVAIMDVVDARQQYEIKELMPATSASRLPSNERIAEAVGGLCIGTFSDPPRGSKVKALIDVHDGAVVAIAPVFQLQDIKRAVDLGPQVLKLRGYESIYQNVGLTAHVLQATDTAEPAASEAEEEADKTPASEADPEGSGRITLPKEMQEKLDELKRRAAEMQAPQQPVSNSDAPPTPPAGTEGEPTSPDSSLGQSRGDAVAPGIPEGFEIVGDEPQAKPEPLRPLDSGVDETAPLVPAQIIPSESERITARPEEPAEEMTTIDVSDLLAQTAESAPAYEPAAFPNGEQTIDLALPERLPVIQLLDLVGKYLGLSYVYDPAKVTGEVTLKLNGNLRGSMKVKDLYVLLESVLQFKELVMTRHKGNIVKIVPKLEALAADPELVTPDAPVVQAGDAVVTRVFELKHIDNSSAENFLQQMGLAVGVTSIVESKTLIVTAYAHRMRRIEQLLRMVDIPGEPRKFRFRQLQYTMAQTLTEKVKALAEQLESITVTVGQAAPATATTRRLPGESEAAYRTRVARLKAAQAAAAARARATQSGQPAEPKPGVYLDADERTNRVLMIGVAEQLTVVDELIDALDVEQQDLRSLQLYRIKHVDAEEVSRKLYELGVVTKIPETPVSGRITSRTARTTPGQPPRPTTPTADVSLAGEGKEGGLGGEPQVVVVESTNSLLVNATAEQHEQIATIIEYVDSEMLQDEVPYKIYPLENSSPAHLAEVLESLIQETIEQDREGKIETTVVSREEKIRIVPDPNTYSLIVYAKKKNQDWIANLVEQLDRRRPQVLIDVTLVEVTKSDAFTYDLNVVRNLSDNDDLKDGRDPNSVLEKFVRWGGGSLSAFYVDKQIDALLTAVQSKNYGRVLAKPKLLVNDNEQGIIETKDITYVEVSSSIPVASGAGGVQTDLIQTSVNFEPYEAGIKLDIVPHISEGDLLRLDIVLTRSDFLKTASVGDRQKPPNTRENQVDTAVTLPDGSTVILGGLLKMNQNKGGGKVPILGDIPVLGGLFRSVDNSDEQSKLYVFVKAEIIRPAETITHGMKDLEVISDRNRVAFERHELEFQRHESWPGIEPAPVDPPKVLDAH